MAYSWNTKPITSTTRPAYSWSDPTWKAEIEQRVDFVKSNPPLSLGRRLYQGMKDSVVSAFKEKEKVDLNMVSGIGKPIVTTWWDTVEDTSKRFNAAMSTYTKPGRNDKSEMAVKTAEAGMGVVNLFFSPITGAMKGLESHPVFGYVATSVNALFSAVGTGSAILAVDQLEKSNLSRETKNELTPIVSEVASLIGMIAVGKAGGAAYNKVRAGTNTILNTFKKETPTIPTKPNVSYPLSINIPVKDGRKVNGPIRVQNWDRMHKVPIVYRGNIYYPPESTLPVIEFGSKARTTEKVIQIGEKGPSIPEGYSYIPITEAVKVAPEYTQKVIEQNQPVTPAAKPAAKPAASTYSWNKTKTTETTKPATEPFQPVGALKFKAEAEKRGLVVDEVPLVERQQNVVQWKSADDFVAKDTPAAIRAYRGDAELPAGVLRNALEGALEKYALENGDMTLANELVKSKLGTETARELQTRNRPLSETSPIQAAREIRQERQADIKDVETRMKEEKAKVGTIKPPSIDTWKEFIKSLEC